MPKSLFKRIIIIIFHENLYLPGRQGRGMLDDSFSAAQDRKVDIFEVWCLSMSLGREKHGVTSNSDPVMTSDMFPAQDGFPDFKACHGVRLCPGIFIPGEATLALDITIFSFKKQLTH